MQNRNSGPRFPGVQQQFAPGPKFNTTFVGQALQTGGEYCFALKINIVGEWYYYSYYYYYSLPGISFEN